MGAAFSAPFLDLSTAGGVVVYRWQSRWIGATVSWESQSWEHQRFEFEGLASGGISTAAQVSLRFAMLPAVFAVLRQAHRQNWMGRLRVYQYRAAVNGAGPPATASEMVLTGTMAGIISIEQYGATEITVRLSSGQLPRGDQFPPRRANQALIGHPCILGNKK